jgi:SnoaL-like domain
MPIDMPEPLTRYFEHDAQRSIDGIVALFADDAIVTDEGETRQGVAEIRAWQLGPASAYTYRTEIRDTEQLGPDRYLVTGRLTGNFPGGTAELTWDFTIAGNKISRLVIAPTRAQSR